MTDGWMLVFGFVWVALHIAVGFACWFAGYLTAYKEITAYKEKERG